MSPPPPFAGRTVVLVGRVDDGAHAHTPLKRRALERLGCAVAMVEPRPRGLLARFRGGDLVARVGEALRDRRPDLVLVLGADGPAPAAVDELRQVHACPWALWWPSDAGRHPTWDLVRAVDHTWVTGRDLVGKVPGVRFLPHAADPSVHRPLRSRDEFRANVVFAGEATPRREAMVAAVLEFGVAVWGRGWRQTRLRDYCRGEAVSGEDYLRAYAGATVALNIHREGPDGTTPGASGCNARTFELAAMGLAQAVDAREDLPALFTPGEELLVYEDPEGLRALVRELVADHARAEALGQGARRRALGEHTYIHRLTTLLEAALPARADDPAE
ncbi:MAG TPA: glycosyltransferase [Gemmatimonadales bacterium]|nr:glycosyltransferase [Gemmatimonadales bacterium]